METTINFHRHATDFLPVIPKEKQEIKKPDISNFDPLATPIKVKRRSASNAKTILANMQRTPKSRSLEIKVYFSDEEKIKNNPILTPSSTVQSGRFTIRTQKLNVLPEDELPIEDEEEEKQIYEDHKNHLNESLERFYKEILA